MRCRAALLPVEKMSLPSPGSAADGARSGRQRSTRAVSTSRDCAANGPEPIASAASTARSNSARVLRPAQRRLEASDVMRDRSPVGATATEAVEHHVPVAIRLEQTDQWARPVAVAERRRVSASTAIASNQLESSGSTKSRAASSSKVSHARSSAPEWAQHSASHRAVGGDVRVLLGCRCQELDHFADAALEETDVDEVHAERGNASGCSAGAWCASASNASVSASSNRPSMIDTSPRQLVVAHDQ